MELTCNPIVRNILRDESITRGLGDIEGRMLIEWLVEWTELFIETSQTLEQTQKFVFKLCKRAKAINHFVQLWINPLTRNGANQLAASERFRWPLPVGTMPVELLMEQILGWENQFPE